MTEKPRLTVACQTLPLADPRRIPSISKAIQTETSTTNTRATQTENTSKLVTQNSKTIDQFKKVDQMKIVLSVVSLQVDPTYSIKEFIRQGRKLAKRMDHTWFLS